jgi:hypothetical protein
VQALKVLVIGMGVAILAIIAVIIVTLVQRMSGGPDPEAGFGEVALAVPEGCALAQAAAGEGRLILRLEGPPGRGCQQAVVLDLESGRVLGRVTATPRP